MTDLPLLRGSPRQIAWAEKIRANAFAQSFKSPSLATFRTIDDSTWWIANRVSGDKLLMTFKDPAPHQCVGGPPPPVGTVQPHHTPRKTIDPELLRELQHELKVADEILKERSGEDGDENDWPKGGASPQPHAAELFAASVCRHPLLAEIAVLGTLARLYKGEVGRMLKWRAKVKLEAVRETIIAEMDKDINGLRRILR